MALTQDGVEARFHDYYRGWVLGWLKFIKPKQFQEADGDDVTHFLARLAGEGQVVAASEVWGDMTVDGIRVHGRADRIDRLANGGLAIIRR